ncbi:hypothetical protein L1987_85217 [Smallanthus sonchifolius]|uniref:Uncharacterized protein n=1 Tax=Smallanthus sonchifolius TaxID=185202 RepID=A0ACB8XWI2_9ASTR|nr:hypothetical protein L1987_85217 [Smallanthus sonchifolius]
MEFKARDYRAEEEFHSLTRVSVSSHPLCSSSSSSSSFTQEDHVSVEFFDPLRGLSTETLEPVEDVVVAEKHPASQPTSHLSTKEWTSFIKLLMQRFPVPKMISVSALSSKTIKGKKAIGELPAKTQLDELNDSEKSTEKGFKILSIKVAMLLMDTCVAQFYPTLFVLATDIMDMLGDMVWERIREKAEFADDGTKICTLSDDFEANSVCLEAKETCNNWFRKIASIHELLPRIYLELAIFPCWRFLRNDVMDNLMRMVMMIRGIADPLASAYCRFFLIHCAQKLPQRDAGHLVTCISDQKLILRQIVSMKETKYGNFLGDHKLLISLMEPTIEYTMRCIFKDSNQVADMIVRLELGKSPSELHGKVPWISIILHYLLKKLPTEVVCSNALEILHLVDCSSDFSFDQCLNYKMVGLKLCEGIDQLNTVDAVIDEVIQAATKRKILDEYLKILDAYMDIILHYNMDVHALAENRPSSTDTPTAIVFCWKVNFQPQLSNVASLDLTTRATIFVGNLEQGAMYIPKSILSLLDSQSWITPKLRIRILCSLLSLSATFAQNEFPYHAIHEEVIGNDRLFLGDVMYSQELGSLSRVILDNMVDTVPQEPSQVARGKLALEACNCITSFYKVNDERSSIRSKLMETAVSCLGGDDKYLQSTINFVHKHQLGKNDY